MIVLGCARRRNDRGSLSRLQNSSGRRLSFPASSRSHDPCQPTTPVELTLGRPDLHHLQRRPDALLEPSPAHSPSLGNSDRDALLPRPSLPGRCSSCRYRASNLAQAGSSLEGQTSALGQSSKHARRDRGREQSKRRAARARCQIETGSASASVPRGARRGGRRRGHRARK